MSLEATMIIVDNSEFTRNGDFVPTRLEAEKDAIHFVFNSKRSGHPESSIGLLSSSGKSPKLLTTLTNEEGRIRQVLHNLAFQSGSCFMEAMQVAQLALKHRLNKNQRQRIVAFIGSPMNLDQEEMIKLAKKLKKNGLAVDLVAFSGQNQGLAEFIQAIDVDGNSHLVEVSANQVISEEIRNSQMMGQGQSAEVNEFGFDANLDPELAMALRMSMEEEQARQTGPNSAVSTNSAASPDQDVEMDEEALLQQAIQLSTQTEDQDSAPKKQE